MKPGQYFFEEIQHRLHLTIVLNAT